MSKIVKKVKAAFAPVPYVPALSNDELLNQTHTQAAAALSFFQAAASDLADAAIVQDEIAGRYFLEIDLLEEKAREAVQASVENAAAASRIRELVGSLG